MDIFLLLLSLLFIITGIAGSFLPIIPGPPISWLGIVTMYLTTAIPVNWWILMVTFIITVAIVIVDYMIPAMGAKKFGGTKAGAYGTTLGLIIGIFLPLPLAFLWCPFIGAFLGEILYTSNHKIAFKAAMGSFLGFLAGTFIKFFVCCMFLLLFVKQLITYRAAIF